jgi:ribokinase
MTRVAVIGHVEWVEFVRLADYPPRGGLEQATWVAEHAGGGAVVAAAVLISLGAEVEFFCALGDDERARPSRFVFTMLDDGGERTIVTVGERLQPAGDDELDWGRLATIDGVYFTAGDDGALAAARSARTLVVTPRAGDHAAGLSRAPRVDATVFSAHDRDEVRWARDWEAHSRLLVATDGADGGRWWGESSGRWPAASVPGPIKDSYGSGDSFAAGLTFGLASGRSVAEAAAIGARCGAEMLTRVGAP